MPSASVTDALRLARRTGFSRLPVMERGADEVLGVVHVKAALAVPRDRRDPTRALSIATPPLYVPEAMDLDRLLAELRRGVDRLAVVVDEYGGIAGVVTMEDLVEELVGDSLCVLLLTAWQQDGEDRQKFFAVFLNEFVHGS